MARERLVGHSSRSAWIRVFLKGPVAVAVLWIFSYQHFAGQPPFKEGGKFRIEYKQAVAYPMSDAGCDFQNALAILSGEGWVNWRTTNRWTVYKPGWAASLAGLAVVCNRDLGKMQTVLSIVLAAAVPAFYLLLLTLFPGARTPPIAFLSAIFFTLYPSGKSWWFQRTMMTEGPTLLLSLAVCALAVHWGAGGAGCGGTDSSWAPSLPGFASCAAKAASRWPRC